jgi:hypothetical protein
MRCDDVIRELSDPQNWSDSPALSGHLAQCDRCAALAARNTRLKRLWEATAPREVSGETWDQVWSAISSGLDRSDTRSGDQVGASLVATDAGSRIPQAARSGRWRSVGFIGLVGFAQAAALLLAVGLSWRGPSRLPGLPRSPQEVRSEVSLNSEFDFEDGQVPLLRSEGNKVGMVDLTALDSANGEDPWFVFFNRVEATSTVVAMAE